MIRAGERIRYSEDLACFLEELGRELRAIIRQGLFGCSVLVHPMEEELCRHHGGRILLHYRVNLLKRSVITKMNRCPRLKGGSGPKRSVATDSKGVVAGNNFIGFECLKSRTRFLAQCGQVRTVNMISLAIEGQ